MCQASKSGSSIDTRAQLEVSCVGTPLYEAPELVESRSSGAKKVMLTPQQVRVLHLHE